MYICPDCGKLYDALPTTEDIQPYGEGGCVELHEVPCSCGCYLEEAKQCAICDEWQVADELTEGVCEYCINREMTADNVEGFVETFETVNCSFDINAAFEYVFTSEEVNQILMRELREYLHIKKIMPPRFEEAIKTYLNDEWAKYLIEQEC